MRKNKVGNLWFVAKGSKQDGEYWIEGDTQPAGDSIVVDFANAKARWA